MSEKLKIAVVAPAPDRRTLARDVLVLQNQLPADGAAKRVQGDPLT